jgi:AraC-like DNA-binding protein
MEKDIWSKWITSADPELWALDALNTRSEELTPLYVHRYLGLRNNKIFTSHDFWEMTYVFRGRGMLQTKKSYPLQSSVAFLIPPNMDHYEDCQEPMDTIWLGLKGRRLRGLEPSKILIGEFPELESAFERLWLSAEHPRGKIGPELDALTSLVLSQFIRLATEANHDTSPCIDEAIAWMHRHYDQPLTVADLAYRFGYSDGYFYRVFKKQTGTTPISYLANIRIQHALQFMKNTTLTIDRIARLVGFADPLYFSRIFKKVIGQSPRQLRKSLN